MHVSSRVNISIRVEDSTCNYIYKQSIVENLSSRIMVTKIEMNDLYCWTRVIDFDGF